MIKAEQDQQARKDLIDSEKDRIKEEVNDLKDHIDNINHSLSSSSSIDFLLQCQATITNHCCISARS